MSCLSDTWHAIHGDCQLRRLAAFEGWKSRDSPHLEHKRLHHPVAPLIVFVFICYGQGPRQMHLRRRGL